jgi:hypothetical protein
MTPCGILALDAEKALAQPFERVQGFFVVQQINLIKREALDLVNCGNHF